MREYRHHGTEATFADDMKKALVKWEKRRIPSAAEAHSSVAPAANVLPIVPATPKPLGRSTERVAAPIKYARAAAVSNPAPPIAVLPTSAPRMPPPPDPSTFTYVARVDTDLVDKLEAINRGSFGDSDDEMLGFRKASPRHRTFAAIEEEDEEEGHGDNGEEAIRMMDDEMAVDSPEPAERQRRDKGKGRAIEAQESEDSDWEKYMRSPVPSKPPARTSRASGRAAAKGKSRAIEPTGEEYSSPCGTCQLAEKRCERNAGGGACVPCKRAKRACKYAFPRTRKFKSRATISSDEEVRNRSRNRPQPAAAPTRTQPPRAAGSRQPPISPMPPVASTSQMPSVIEDVRNPFTTPLTAAAGPSHRRPSPALGKDGRRRMDVIVEVAEEPDDVVLKQVHRRKSALPAARRKGKYSQKQ